MRWAFWKARSGVGGQAPDEARPLPDDVGLPSGRPEARSAAARDEDDQPVAPPRVEPLSGAGPDPGVRRARPEPGLSLDEGSAGVDGARVATCGPVVAAVVRAVLAEDADGVVSAVRPLADVAVMRSAAVAAAGALAARLPALSGVDEAVGSDEHAGDLLHAYADLLAGRAEPRRGHVKLAVSREQLVVVAHLSAVCALGDAAGEPALLVLPGIPAEEQLVAGCVLLAQTCVDGGGDVGGLAGEVAALFG